MMDQPDRPTDKSFEKVNRLQEALAVAQTEIQQLVAQNKQLQTELAVAQASSERLRFLEASNEDLTQFAYAVSHDLQEPLRMITSYLQLVAQRYEDQLDEEAREFIGYAVGGANRMRQLIIDLLAYSQIGHEHQGFTQVDLEKILQQVLFNLAVQIREANIQITHDPLPTIMANKTQMLQLLQNLLSNAVKFRTADTPKIHLSAQQQASNWIIQVSDNGIGIEPELTPKVFAIFQRLHTNEEYPGTGIGLATCKKIIQNHQGSIWVESEPGVGSIFSFSIPIYST
jgi:light-regulated signal transduction histidine kinase (bacteriophytochrome)